MEMDIKHDPRWRTAIVVLGAAELVTTTVALVDLVRRPRERVRGPKAAWFAACAVQPVGPVAYLLLGRRRGVAQAGIGTRDKPPGGHRKA